MSAYAGIYLLDAPYCIDNIFDYYIPPHLRRDILCGDFVAVPFGTANRKKIGLVAALKDSPDKKSIDCKSVIEVLDKSISLSDEAMGLSLFLKEQTLCTVGDAAKAIAPISQYSRMEEIYLPADTDTPPADATASIIFEYIKKKQGASLATLKSKYGPATEEALKVLVASGHVKKDFTVKSIGEKFEEYASLSISCERAVGIVKGELTPKLRSEKQAQLLLYLSHIDEKMSVKLLLEECNATKAQLNALKDKGLIKVTRQTVDRGLGLIKYEKKHDEITLNEEQQAAYERLCSLSDSGEAHGVLLHGVTGSGKTSVMIKTIDHVLQKEKGVIVLLPEIALTPQSLQIFCSRYGERVAIIHSALSAGERIDTYKRIKSGNADVVIGTRSAVFAPISNLGLIIIDEEQEHTYKSDMNPKYHTRDVARYRAAYHKGIMLLASATPSFESYKKAIDGKYTLIELKSRYGGATLPQAVIEDMRIEMQAGNTSPLGANLCRRLLETKQAKNQSILFINRRGYNNFISCRKCGDAIKCPRCSVSMTYHTGAHDYENGYLVCHWCGKRMPVPSTCPSCSDTHLVRMGYGTQRVEQELKQLLPDARILRMDTDTTGEKTSYEEMLGKFRMHKADILLGTQMVTKGHDFPDVTLVGVLLADTSLYLDDYRASERTFAMLTQVIGRAGRASKKGVAVIQTSNPDNECIQLACAQDYKTFYESEIKLRKLLSFPPFCDIALLTLVSPNEKEVLKASTLLSEKINSLAQQEYSDLPLIVFGPFEAPVYKVENKFRMRTVVKFISTKRSRKMLSELLKYFSASGAHSLTLSIDINPTNL